MLIPNSQHGNEKASEKFRKNAQVNTIQYRVRDRVMELDGLWCCVLSWCLRMNNIIFISAIERSGIDRPHSSKISVHPERSSNMLTCLWHSVEEVS